jgi:hypothetical protein
MATCVASLKPGRVEHAPHCLHQHSHRLAQLPRDGVDGAPPEVKPKTLGKAKR